MIIYCYKKYECYNCNKDMNFNNDCLIYCNRYNYNFKLNFLLNDYRICLEYYK